MNDLPIEMKKNHKPNVPLLTKEQQKAFFVTGERQARKDRATVRTQRAMLLFTCVMLCFVTLKAVMVAQENGYLHNFSYPVNEQAPKVELLQQQMPKGLSIIDADPETPHITSKQEPKQEQWSLLLANTDHPLPTGYEESVTYVTPFADSAQQVDERILEPIQEMFDAARNDGIYLYFRSGYRSHATQTNLFYSMVTDYQNGVYTGYTMSYEAAYAAAKKWRNVPGTSEHQTGLAADIVSANTPFTALIEDLQYTKEAIWLKEHCAEFGFILRYPDDKTHITGTSFEPWHFRYVGNPAATEIMEQKVCLEEYLEALEGEV